MGQVMGPKYGPAFIIHFKFELYLLREPKFGIAHLNKNLFLNKG